MESEDTSLGLEFEMSLQTAKAASGGFRKTIILTGAPIITTRKYPSRESDQLANRNHSEESKPTNLLDVFDPIFLTFAQRCCGDFQHAEHRRLNSQHLITSDLSRYSTDAPVWRVLRNVSDHMPSGMSQRRWLLPKTPQNKSNIVHRRGSGESHMYPSTVGANTTNAQMSFLSPSLESSSESFDSSLFAEQQDDDGEDRLSDYLDQSYTLFEEYIGDAPSASSKPGVALTKSDEVYTSNLAQKWPYSTLEQMPHPSKVPFSGSATPKPPLVSIIAVVISITGPREVVIRRTGRKTHLYELLLGDETAGGFGVTIWVGSHAKLRNQGYPQTRQQANKSLRIDFADSPGDLKPGTVIELLNIALTKFRDRVYGQSQGVSRKSDITRTRIFRAGPASNLLIKDTDGLSRRMKERVAVLKRWWRDFTTLETVGGESPTKRKEREVDSHDAKDGKESKRGRWLPPDESMIR